MTPSRDPIGYVDGENTYVLNAALSGTDPSGLCCFGCYAAKTEVNSVFPTDGNTTGDVGISITSLSYVNGTCGAFSWTIQYRLEKPVEPSYVLQKVTVEYSVFDCKGRLLRGKTVRYWEAWPYKDTRFVGGENGLLGDGFDTFSNEGVPTCTKGTFSFFGEYGLVKGLMPMPPFVLRGEAPHTTLPSTTADPQVITTGKLRRHELEVSWDCCECVAFPEVYPMM